MEVTAPGSSTRYTSRALPDLRAHLAPERVARQLASVLALLLLAHAAGLVMTFGLGHPYVYGLVPLFNIGLEGNIPTFFSSLLFLGNGLLFGALAGLARAGSRERRVWAVLAAVFAFLAIDEFAVIHEMLIDPVRSLFDLGGLLYFAWVLPYLAAALFLAVYCAPVLWGEGPRYRLLFGLAAAAYLGGAVGIEMLGGSYFESIGADPDLHYRLYQTVEETLEFVGLILLVYTLLALLRERSPALLLRVDLRKHTSKEAT